MTATADDVWQLLGELIQAQKETERRFQETERLLKEQSRKTDRQIQQVNEMMLNFSRRFGKQSPSLCC